MPLALSRKAINKPPVTSRRLIFYAVFSSGLENFPSSNLLSEGESRETGRTKIDLTYLFFEKENRCRFLFGVIPQRQGSFILVFSDSNNSLRKHDRCAQARFFLLFRATDQHYRLNPFYIPETDPIGGDYYFVVK